jgi:large subunit ribosomal protein L6
MSRIGKQPITIPENVTVTIKEDLVVVKLNNQELSQAIPAGIKVELKDNSVIVTKIKETRQTKALHGLIRSLINNMIIGVSEGFMKTLELQGTGYRVAAKGKGIELSLGFSHPINYEAPEGVKVEVKDQTTLVISGIDKQQVGETAAIIRQFRTPDAYKGKGVRYQGEVVKLKPGKAAKAAEGS